MAKAGFIAIVGRPNSGKSTLLNNVLGTEISIVTPKAQTTRDQVLGIFTDAQGQIVFVDTPGIHKARAGGINEYMVHQAKVALEDPHLVWYLVDPLSSVKHEEPVIELLSKAPCPILVLINKTDIFGKKKPDSTVENLENQLSQALVDRGANLKGIRRISGLAGAGVSELLTESWAFLPEGDPYYPDPDQLSDRPVRFFVSEKIREQLFYQLGDELPYACAVEIERFDEKVKPPRIEAMIFVERDSQKGMVIGQGGKKIKEIGQAARVEIEKFLGTKVFLGLRVKVLKDWSQNSIELKRMGYSLPPARKK